MDVEVDVDVEVEVDRVVELEVDVELDVVVDFLESSELSIVGLQLRKLINSIINNDLFKNVPP